MTAERYTQAWELFHAALERSETDRAAFIEEQCGDDAGLRDEVQGLLARDASPGSFMASPLADREVEVTRAVDQPASEAGKRIDRYEIKRIIGTGGMGTVFEAAQDHPHRLVALKVLRHGAASASAMKRFKHEAEILGRLRHSNIAQIYDAGTFDEGHGAQPYFVMELVKGEALTDFVEAKKLGTQERLDLFVKVCNAVQYAHHKGVIHRDLKPDNVLVDDFGEPRILDFGVARATDSDIQVTTLQTDVGQLMGTVPYMSPEQVSGDPAELDTRSDVYSLGVMLYELLCGKMPHDLANMGIPEAIRVIREDDPTPLSSINRIFRGDLETIVAKALDKERERRYQSSAELGADIRHYLKDEPIVARPASTFYQIRKFTRRNRALAGGIVGMFSLLVIGIIGTSAGFIQARAERNAAQEEARKSAAINEYLMELFAMANPAEDSDELADSSAVNRVGSIEDLIDQAAERLETALPEWPQVRAGMHYRLGKTYYGLGRNDEMGAHLHRAYELYRDTVGEKAPETLLSLGWYAYYLQEEDRNEEAEPLFRQVVAGFTETLGAEDRRTIGVSIWLGSNLSISGKYGEAEDVFLDAIDRASRHFGEDDRITLAAWHRYGWVLQAAQRYSELEEHLGRALQLARTSLPDTDLLSADLAWRIGEVLKLQVRTGEAVGFLREAYEIHHRASDGVTGSALRATFSYTAALRSLDDASTAEAINRRKVDDCMRVLGPDHENTLWAELMLGWFLFEEGRLTEAEGMLRESVEHFGPILGGDADMVLFAKQGLGWALRDQDRLEEARVVLQEVLDGRETDSIYGRDARYNLAGVLVKMNRLQEAEVLYRAQLAIQRRVHGSESPAALLATDFLASFLKDRGPRELAEAEELARTTLAIARSVRGEDDQMTWLIADTMAVVLYLQGKHEEAVTEFEQVAAAGLTSMSSVQYGRCLTKLERFEQAETVLLASPNGVNEDARQALTDLYDAWRKPEKAAEYRALNSSEK